MSERLPPPYGLEKKEPRPSAIKRHLIPAVSVADAYSQSHRRTAHQYNHAIGIEITVLSNATGSNRRVQGPHSYRHHDDNFRSQALDPAQMSHQPEQQENTIYRNTSRESDNPVSSLSQRNQYSPPSAPPPSANSQEIQGRQRGDSTTSGSSAYTGYNDGSSSPTNQRHNPTLSSPKRQKSSILADLKEAPILNRLFVQNDTSPKQEKVPEQVTPKAGPPSRLQRNKMPPPITTRKETRVEESPRNYQPPLPGPSSINYSPVAAYMTTPHGGAFPSSPTAARPATASGLEFGVTPNGLASPRLNSSFPDYRQGANPGMVDVYGVRQATNYADPLRYAPRPSLDGAPMSAITSPARRQTKKRVAASHACMTLHRMDRLKLVKFPPSALYAVKSAIERSWIKGIQNEKETAGQTEIQFRGNPWSGQGDDTCPAVYTMSEIMSALYHLGWNLVMATDISKRAMDKDTLIYRQGEIPSPCTFMAVSFNDGDKLRLIKAPNDVINAVKNAWGGNIQRESWKLEGLAWEFKLTGSPWWSSGEESLSVRILLLNMLDAMSALGWDLHSSVDITAGPGGLSKNAGSDTDCWVLRKVNT